MRLANTAMRAAAPAHWHAASGRATSFTSWLLAAHRTGVLCGVSSVTLQAHDSCPLGGEYL